MEALALLLAILTATSVWALAAVALVLAAILDERRQRREPDHEPKTIRRVIRDRPPLRLADEDVSNEDFPRPSA